MLLQKTVNTRSDRSACSRPYACKQRSISRVSFVAEHLRTRRSRCRAAEKPQQPPDDDSTKASSSNDDSNTTSNASSGNNISNPSNSAYQLPWEDDEPKQLPPNYDAIKASIPHMDSNQLQTALGVVIAAEDYAVAAQIKERLQQKLHATGSAVLSQPMDWRALGVPDWLADRAERLGFMFPTEVQRRAAPVILSGADTVIASETGSGKTAAFLVPALSKLDYPPDLFPDDLEGPQLLLLVPSFELGVQACMLLFKLWGGNISSRTPGDPANMFSYTGPPGVKVRGVLNDEELQMAVTQSRYLRGVHAVVATPDMALALSSLQDSPLSFQDLRVIVADEMDALLDAYPASFGQLMDAAVSRHVPGSSSSSGSGADGDPATEGNDTSSAAATGDDAQGRLDKVRDLLERQQPKAGPGPGGGADDAALAGSSSSSREKLAAALAAARLEGLMSAPSAAGIQERQQPQQQQQQQQQQDESSSSSSSASPQPSPADAVAADASSIPSSSSSSSSMNSDAAAAAAAEGILDDTSPMAKPQVVLVGATVNDDDVRLAVQRGWIDEPVIVRVGEAGSVPAGLKHRVIVVSSPEKRLGGLVISLRKDLADALAAADAAAGAGTTTTAASQAQTTGAGPHPAPVRVIIFAPSEAEAKAAAEPLRSALWGDHMLSVLLPSMGAEPIKALHAFRDRVASMLLATPSAARGLDLPAVSHVYSIGLPLDATEYVHKAGRAGRIGSTSGGDVCTIVTREELQKFLGMVEGELGLQVEIVELDRDQGLGLLGDEWAAARAELLADLESAEAENQQQKGGSSEQQLETARKGLDDLFNLL